jgi:hypothetical protein
MLAQAGNPERLVSAAVVMGAGREQLACVQPDWCAVCDAAPDEDMPHRLGQTQTSGDQHVALR